MKTHINRFKKSLIVLAISLGLIVPALTATVSADSLFSGAKDEACSAVEATEHGNCSKDKLDAAQNTLSQTLANLLNLLTMVVGILTVIMLIISGIRFVTAGGDTNSVTSAKNTLIYALVGLIIVAFAQAIVRLVLNRIS